MSMQRVAQLAGVSTSTVSRFFHNDPCVAPETAAVVRKAVQELGFAPATRRRRSEARLATTSHTVAFLVLGASGSNATPAFERLLRSVSAAADAHDLSLTLNFVADPTQLPRRLFDLPLAGVLCHGDQPGASSMAQLRSLPTVWLMANRHRPQWGDQVMPNNAVIGDMAARYLVRQGHRRLAYLGASRESWSMRLRAFAFRKAAEDAGVAVEICDAPTAAGRDFWDADGLAAVADRLVDCVFRDDERPTGLFVEEDRLFPEIDRALRARGVRPAPGGEVEIVSCNDERPHYAGLATLPARIDIRPEAVGRRGVEQLVWRMRNPDLSERVRVMVEPALIEPGPAIETNGRHEANGHHAANAAVSFDSNDVGDA